MKRVIVVLLLIVGIIAIAQINPSYQQFNTNQFFTNATPWKIALKSNLSVLNLTVMSNTYFNDVIVSNVAIFKSNVTINANIFASNAIIIQGTALNPQALFLPTLDYELWYDPFQGRDLAAGAVGQLGWTSIASGGGGSIAVSNAVNHFGTIAMTTSATSNNGYQLHLSSVPVLKPVVPPLNATAGWTNRIIWRLNGTNAVRGYLVFTAGNFTSTLDMTNAIGIAIHSSTNSSIMGYCANASSVSTTNLDGGTLVSERWYTNFIWSASPGVISFNVNGGPAATLSANIPTVALTPNIGFRKFAASVSSLEIDDWMLVIARQ